MKSFITSLLFIFLFSTINANDNVRIVGGQETNNSYPFMAGLVVNSYYGEHVFCGGALIDPEWVVTAAHCVEQQSSFSVVLGKHYISDQTGGEKIGISKIYSHPSFSGMQFGVVHDIALVKLSQPSSLKPAALMDSTVEATLASPGDMATVAGWGTRQEGVSNPPDGLYEVALPIVSNTTCNRVYGSINSGQICAGYSQGGKDACQGDSGGPLFVSDSSGNYYSLGIVSYGNGCGKAGYYGVYTRVSAYRDWIIQTIGRNPDTGGGDTGGGLPDKYSCYDMFGCFETCAENDDACMQNCYYNSTPEAQDQYDAIAQCYQTYCESAADSQSCLEQNCQTEINACVGDNGNTGGDTTGEYSCNDMFGCFETCGDNDDACLQDCYYNSTSAAQDQYDAIAQCYQAYCENSADSQRCLEQNCQSEINACFGDDGSGGDSGSSSGGDSGSSSGGDSGSSSGGDSGSSSGGDTGSSSGGNSGDDTGNTGDNTGGNTGGSSGGNGNDPGNTGDHTGGDGNEVGGEDENDASSPTQPVIEDETGCSLIML